ncbi:MAG TPA: hypothetical protein VLJ76_11380 [Gaiellaceae bacterium]|nr:hypothetical protein [Gaiellaceae bacterium]
MSIPFIAALTVFGLLNVVGLAVARTWRGFVAFYGLAVALLCGTWTVVVLAAQPGIPDSWPGHVDSFGHEVSISEALATWCCVLWLALLGLTAAVTFVGLRLPRRWFQPDPDVLDKPWS